MPQALAAGRVLAAFLLVLGLMTAAGEVWAHAFLMETTPEDGATLERAPATAVLRFNEPVSVLAAALTDENSRALTAPGAVSVEGATMRLALPANPPKGVYRLSYRVASADGHPVAGDIRFGVGMTPPAETGVETHGEKAAEDLALLTRWAHYLSLLAATGGGLFWVLVGPGARLKAELRPRLAGLLVVAMTLTLLHLGASGLALADVPILSLTEARPWRLALEGGVGRSLGVALAGLTLTAAGLGAAGLGLERRRAAIADTALIAGAALGALSLGLTGHVAALSPAWAAVGLVWAHGLMAAFWIGALGPLALALKVETPEEARRLVHRFARLAIGAVAVLALAGIGLSVWLIGSVEAVTASAYGRHWLTKMVAVAGLLGVAGVNRLRVTPALDGGRVGAAKVLMATIAVEMILVALILNLTAGFALTPPPLAPVPAVVGGFTASVTVDRRTAVITVDPARVGSNHLMVYLSGADGAPLTPAEAELTLTPPDNNAGPSLVLRPGGAPGSALRFAGIALPVGGAWTLALSLRTAEGQILVLRTPIPVSPTTTTTGARP